MTIDHQQIEQGTRLDQLIKTLKISSKRFAASISVSQGFVSQMSTGKRPITHKVLNNITNRYSNVNTHWLMTGFGEMFISVGEGVSEPGFLYGDLDTTPAHIETFSKNFTAIRKRWLLSQTAFADLLGTTRFVVGNIERGRNYPGYEIASKLETLSGFTLKDLSARELSPIEIPALPKSGLPDTANPMEDIRVRLERMEGMLRELLERDNIHNVK